MGCDIPCDLLGLILVYISIRAPLCGVRHKSVNDLWAVYLISIRAPLCGVRLSAIHGTGSLQSISIRAPLCGVRPGLYRAGRWLWISIRAPLCGVRLGLLIKPAADSCDFNPRTPMWGATTVSISCGLLILLFQSAHPYVGCDKVITFLFLNNGDFNPRTPMWGATAEEWTCHEEDTISIRAPLCGVRPP